MNKQEAIEVLNTYDVYFDGYTAEEIVDAIDIAIEALQSQQPKERPKGEWIPKFDGKFTGGAYWFSCSKCERIVPDVRNGGWNFCPNCGARMDGKEQEHE